MMVYICTQMIPRVSKACERVVVPSFCFNRCKPPLRCMWDFLYNIIRIPLLSFAPYPVACRGARCILSFLRTALSFVTIIRLDSRICIVQRPLSSLFRSRLHYGSQWLGIIIESQWFLSLVDQ